MFFCLNLVFATSNPGNTRVIQGEEDLDITINLKDNDYVLTNAVIDPFTKSNLYTYIVKENVPISFNLVNTNMNPRQALLKIFYYRTIKNKNIKIRCLDTLYLGGGDIKIVPDAAFNVLKATHRLNSCIFIFNFEYKVVNADKQIVDKNIQYAFKIVSDREYKLYKDMEEFNAVKAYNDSIIKPKKIK